MIVQKQTFLISLTFSSGLKYHDMKKLLLFGMFLSSSILAFADKGNSHSFLSEGKQWNEHEVYIYRNGKEGVDINQTTYYSYFIKGDTIVGGHCCYKLYRSDDTGTSYHCAMYEDGSKVYYVPSGSSESKLLYDFSMSIGEELSDYAYWPRPYVFEVDNVMVGVDCLRRLKFTDEDHLGPTLGGAMVVAVVSWAEGVGSDGGLFGIYNSLPEIVSISHSTYGKWGVLDSCYENGKCVFTNDDFHKEGIAEGVVGITYSCESERGVYDLQGRRVFQSQRNGLYIKDGKKYLMK
jgi:hypothetical protein